MIVLEDLEIEKKLEILSDAAKYDYIPVMGAGTAVYVKRTQVTNAEYAAFLA